MYTVNTSPRPTVVVMKGASASHCLHSQICFAHVRLDSSRRRIRTCHPKTSRVLTACKAQAAGSPTLEKPGQASQTAQQTDVVVIGSGIGGLCCAALLAKYGLKVVQDPCKALTTQKLLPAYAAKLSKLLPLLHTMHNVTRLAQGYHTAGACIAIALLLCALHTWCT